MKIGIVTTDVEEKLKIVNYPVGLPSEGILSARTWADFDQELEARYRDQGLGSIQRNRHSPGDDRERARIPQFNQLWPQYTDFVYQANRLGFRDLHEPLDQVDHCYYGCSMTYGEGVPNAGVWTSQLDKILGTSSNNFGIGGTSVEECMLMFLTTSRLVKMKRAVFLFPDFHRKTMCVSAVNNQRDCIYVPFLGTYKEDKPHLDRYNRNIRDARDTYYRLPGVHMMDSFRTVVQHILYVAELRGIEIVMGTWNAQTAQVLNHMKKSNPSLKIADWIPIVDEGRDQHHPGIVTQANWAKEFAKVI